MPKTSCAIAIFAKTRALSPVKTRLRKDISDAKADAFYTLALAATEELVKRFQAENTSAIAPYWALAEEAALTCPQWQGLNRLWTGEGDFGTRLHNVYFTLQKTHDTVILIGTDSPHITIDHFTQTLDRLENDPHSCVIGPAFDGGFYLFAARRGLAENIWKKVHYGQSSTLAELQVNLTQAGIKFSQLAPMGDVDTGRDLAQLKAALAANRRPLKGQKKLYEWLIDNF